MYIQTLSAVIERQPLIDLIVSAELDIEIQAYDVPVCRPVFRLAAETQEPIKALATLLEKEMQVHDTLVDTRVLRGNGFTAEFYTYVPKLGLMTFTQAQATRDNGVRCLAHRGGTMMYAQTEKALEKTLDAFDVVPPIYKL